MASLPRITKTRVVERVPTGNQKFYKSRAWRRARQSKLQVNPVCEVHQSIGELIACTSNSPIDHIIAISQGGASVDDRNLMTLCVSCHERKSNLESKSPVLLDWDVNQFGERIPIEGGRELIIKFLSELI